MPKYLTNEAKKFLTVNRITFNSFFIENIE